jgi:hypothetical protein
MPVGRVRLLGYLASGSGLGGVLLSSPQFSDRLGERGKPGDQRHQRKHAVIRGHGDRGHEPRGLARAVAGLRGAGNPAVRSTRGTVVTVGRPAKDSAAKRSGGRMQGVCGGPGGIRRGSRGLLAACERICAAAWLAA